MRPISRVRVALIARISLKCGPEQLTTRFAHHCKASTYADIRRTSNRLRRAAMT